MLLAIDIGNTNITIGAFHHDELYFVSRMASDVSRMEDQYAIELRDILSIYNVNGDHIDGAVISSVVPKLTEYISVAVKKLFGIDAFIVRYDTVAGLEIAIKHPESIGADLIAGYIAAKGVHKGPCIVIDMGTATTILVIDKEGKMLGGSIIPGIGISLDALINRAALLPSIGLEAPAKVIGDSTAECIRSGMIYGTASMLDGLCDRMEAELGYTCKVIATGGLAKSVVKNCKRDILLMDTLLLDGLKLIYNSSAN